MARVLDYLNRQLPTTPTQEIGIGGFTALVRTRERYKLAADVPVTPVEDGSYVNDHIIRKPLTITIEGDVSDVHVRPAPLTQYETRALAEIGNIAAQFGLSQTSVQTAKIAALANDATAALRQIDARLDAGTQAWGYLGLTDTTAKPVREQFLDAIEAYHRTGVTLSIDMPYRHLDNMVITAFTSATDNMVDATTFTLEAQKLQYADLVTGTLTRAEGVDGQVDEEVDEGTQEGETQEESVFWSILEAWFGK